MLPLILHIPHSSTYIPEEYRNEFSLTDAELAQELLAMTDTYTDQLFPEGYERVVFPVSRLVCDPERFRDDEEESMSQRGMGAVYTHGSQGQPIRTPRNREAILRRFYDPPPRQAHPGGGAGTGQAWPLSDSGLPLLLPRATAL